MDILVKNGLITSVLPKLNMGLGGGIYCLLSSTDAKIPTAVAMTIITGYAARWGYNAGLFLGIPVGSRASGLTVQEIKQMHNNPAQLRQLLRDKVKFYNDFTSAHKEEDRDAIAASATPRLRAHAGIKVTATVTSFLVAGVACWSLKPAVSHYMHSKFETPQISSIEPLHPNLEQQGITFRNVPQLVK